MTPVKKLQLSKEEVDEILREKYVLIFATSDPKVIRDSLVIGGPDLFGNGVRHVCACGSVVYIRPWLDVYVKKFDMIVWCARCAWALDAERARGELLTHSAMFAAAEQKKHNVS